MNDIPLVNKGMFCYLNASIQAFTHLPLITEELFNGTRLEFLTECLKKCDLSLFAENYRDPGGNAFFRNEITDPNEVISQLILELHSSNKAVFFEYVLNKSKNTKVLPIQLRIKDNGVSFTSINQSFSFQKLNFVRCPDILILNINRQLTGDTRRASKTKLDFTVHFPVNLEHNCIIYCLYSIICRDSSIPHTICISYSSTDKIWKKFDDMKIEPFDIRENTCKTLIETTGIEFFYQKESANFEISGINIDSIHGLINSKNVCWLLCILHSLYCYKEIRTEVANIESNNLWIKSLQLFFRNHQTSDIDPLEYDLIGIDKQGYSELRAEYDMIIRQFEAYPCIINKFLINIRTSIRSHGELEFINNMAVVNAYTSIPLELSYNLKDALNHYFAPFEINDYYIEDLQVNTCVNAQYFAINSPEILCFMLERATYKKKTNETIKNRNQFQFPIETEFISDEGVTIYDLYSIVIHSGQFVDSGHYTIFIHDPNLNLFLYFNDNNFKIHTWEEVMQLSFGGPKAISHALMIQYRKKQVFQPNISEIPLYQPEGKDAKIPTKPYKLFLDHKEDNIIENLLSDINPSYKKKKEHIESFGSQISISTELNHNSVIDKKNENEEQKRKVKEKVQIKKNSCKNGTTDNRKNLYISNARKRIENKKKIVELHSKIMRLSKEVLFYKKCCDTFLKVDTQSEYPDIVSAETSSSLYEPRASYNEWQKKKWLKILLISSIGFKRFHFKPEYGKKPHETTVRKWKSQYRLSNHIPPMECFNDIGCIDEIAKFWKKIYNREHIDGVLIYDAISVESSLRQDKNNVLHGILPGIKLKFDGRKYNLKNPVDFVLFSQQLKERKILIENYFVYYFAPLEDLKAVPLLFVPSSKGNATSENIMTTCVVEEALTRIGLNILFKSSDADKGYDAFVRKSFISIFRHIQKYRSEFLSIPCWNQYISDPAHLLKRFRRLTSQQIKQITNDHCVTKDEIAKKIELELDIIYDLRPITKLDDYFPAVLYSHVRLQKLLQNGNIEEIFSFLIPSSLNIAIRCHKITNKDRVKLLLLGLLLMLNYFITPHIFQVNNKIFDQNITIQYISTVFNIIMVFIFIEEKFGIDRLGTLILEHFFGQIRSMAQNNNSCEKLTQCFNDMIIMLTISRCKKKHNIKGRLFDTITKNNGVVKLSEEEILNIFNISSSMSQLLGLRILPVFSEHQIRYLQFEAIKKELFSMINFKRFKYYFNINPSTKSLKISPKSSNILNRYINNSKNSKKILIDESIIIEKPNENDIYSEEIQNISQSQMIDRDEFKDFIENYANDESSFNIDENDNSSEEEENEEFEEEMCEEYKEYSRNSNSSTESEDSDSYIEELLFNPVISDSSDSESMSENIDVNIEAFNFHVIENKNKALSYLSIALQILSTNEYFLNSWHVFEKRIYKFISPFTRSQQLMVNFQKFMINGAINVEHLCYEQIYDYSNIEHNVFDCLSNLLKDFEEYLIIDDIEYEDIFNINEHYESICAKCNLMIENTYDHYYFLYIQKEKDIVMENILRARYSSKREQNREWNCPKCKGKTIIRHRILCKAPQFLLLQIGASFIRGKMKPADIIIPEKFNCNIICNEDIGTYMLYQIVLQEKDSNNTICFKIVFYRVAKGRSILIDDTSVTSVELSLDDPRISGLIYRRFE